MEVRTSVRYYGHNKSIVTTYSIYVNDCVFEKTNLAWSSEYNSKDFIDFINRSFDMLPNWKPITHLK
jgi:tricorn protease-like protein